MPPTSKVRTTNGRGRLFDSVLDTVGDTPCIRVNHLAPKGVRIYELLAGLPGDPDIAPSAADLRCQKLTEQAFLAYIGGDFRTALSHYEELAKAFPDDPIGPMFMQRCNEYLTEPPGVDWSGVTRMTTK